MSVRSYQIVETLRPLGVNLVLALPTAESSLRAQSWQTDSGCLRLKHELVPLVSALLVEFREHGRRASKKRLKLIEHIGIY